MFLNIGADAKSHSVDPSEPGLLTQGGRGGGRPAPQAARLHRTPTHSPLHLHSI
jgi:hypothetical protein